MWVWLAPAIIVPVMEVWAWLAPAIIVPVMEVWAWLAPAIIVPVMEVWVSVFGMDWNCTLLDVDKHDTCCVDCRGLYA